MTKHNAKISIQKVNFKNRYGIQLAGDLYLPNGYETKKNPAVVISGPFGAVKEQASGLYAQELAKRGFVSLAFDPSFCGESGGEVTQYRIAGNLHGGLQRCGRLCGTFGFCRPGTYWCDWDLRAVWYGGYGRWHRSSHQGRRNVFDV